jgi:hypothetical protein
MSKEISDGEREQNERIKENLRTFDWENAGLYDLEDVFEDRDPFEFL